APENQWTPDLFRSPDRPDQAFVRETTAQNGEANCDGRASRISSAWRRRDVGSADYRRGNVQVGIQGRAKYDVGKQRHDQPIPRSHRSDEIQNVSNLPQTVTLLTTTAK